MPRFTGFIQAKNVWIEMLDDLHNIVLGVLQLLWDASPSADQEWWWRQHVCHLVHGRLACQMMCDEPEVAWANGIIDRQELFGIGGSIGHDIGDHEVIEAPQASEHATFLDGRIIDQFGGR